MKKTPHPKSHALILMLGSCLLVVNAAVLTIYVKAQDCVPPPLHAGETRYRSSWPSGSTVTVKIDSSYSDAQRQAIERGIKSWSGVVGVTFTGFQPAANLSPTAAPSPGTMHVVRSDITGSDNANYFVVPDSNGRIGSSIVRIHPDKTDPDSLAGTGAHETGHQLGLDHCENCDPSKTIMASPPSNGVVPPTDRNSTYGPAPGLQGPTDCDKQVVQSFYPPPTPTPTPPPNCTDNDGDGYGIGPDCWFEDCDDWNSDLTTNCGGGGRDPNFCGGDCSLRCLGVGAWCDPYCTCYTPIVIDTEGDGIRLTGGQGGVYFDIDGDPATVNRLGWTEADSDDAWLALDRDGNGTIDSGRELFGDLTAQPPSDDPNGFRALAVFDRVESGGNADGVISGQDAIYASLRLWRDTNHNGVSEAGELHTLSGLGLESIDLDYKTAKRRDRHGNVFRYRAKVRDARGRQLGRWAWDVFPVTGR